MLYANYAREKLHNLTLVKEARGYPCVFLKSKGKNLKDYKIYGNSNYKRKNLLDFNNMKLINTTETAVRAGWEFEFKKRIDITISHDSIGELPVGILMAKKVTDGVYGSNIQLISNTTTIFLMPNEKLLVFVGAVTVARGYEMLAENSITKIQVEKGTEATEHEEYQEPNPINPLEIESVGEKTNNLINIHIISNSYCTVIDDALEVRIISGNSSAPTSKTIKELCPDIEVGKTYTLSYNVNSNYLSCISFGAFGTTANQWRNGEQRTISEEDLTQLIRIGDFDSGGRVLMFSEMQIVEGEVKQEYEPYGKYKIPVKVRGLNLIDYTKAIPRNSSQKVVIDTSNNAVIWSGDYYFEIPINISSGNIVTLSLESDYSYMYTVVYADKTYSPNIKIGNSFELPNDIVAIRIYKLNASTIEENMVFKNIMLVYGEVATSYESYVEPVTTNVFLDEPLRKIGNYADYIDFKKRKVFRNTGKVDLGTLTWFSPTGYSGYLYYTTKLNDMNYKEQGTPLGLCPNYKINPVYGGWAVADTFEGVTINWNTGAIQIKDLRFLSDKAGFTDAVKNVFLYYSLTATDDGKTINLPNIPTNKGTTIIETDTNISPSDIWVKYISK